MKKIFLSLLLFCVLRGGIGFGYLEHRVYCELDANYIKVYLYKENARKCSDYVNSLDQSILLVYKDMVTVQQLIELGRDVEYRTVIKNDMQNKIDGYQQMRANILYRVTTFEQSFFDKIKLYMERYLLPYKQELEIQLEIMERQDYSDFSGDSLDEASTYAMFIQNQLLIIENILSTQNLEELVSYIPSYLYLKKEIEGK